MIPPSLVEEIKYRNDIESVVSSYVNLKHAGSNLVGLCPFHSEKTPSFTVFKSSENFKCFGCGAGGDVVTFIMKIENLSYIEALQFLAKRAGITIPEDDFGIVKPEVNPKRLYDMNKAAAHFFHDTLISTPEGKIGLNYFKEKRKFSDALINHFGLGYAPDSFNSLADYLKGLGYTEKEMSVGFLRGISKKNGKPYDYFRNRVIIPIIDTKGDVIAFGGRVLDDSLPKYLNSSDTPIFKKSRHLFALNFARANCGDRIILCEGYMDVIALHGAGFTNAVATLGTAITANQARIMERYTKEVVIAYDSDSAGQTAAEKAFRLLGEVGVNVRILNMEGAKDPDEYIKKFGRAKFADILDKSKTHFDFTLDGILKRYDIRSDADKIKAAEEAVRFISATPSAVERDVYIGKAAEKIGINKDGLKTDVVRQMKKNTKHDVKETGKKIIAQTGGLGDRINPDYMKNVRAASAEEAILGIILKYPEFIEKIKLGNTKLNEDDFFTAFGKRVFSETMKIYTSPETFDYGLLGEFFTADEMGRITSYIIKRQALSSNGDRELSDCISVLKEEKNAGNEDISSLLARKRQQKQ